MIEYVLKKFRWCPECKLRKSLAAITEHICEDCKDIYIYCVECANKGTEEK